MQRWPIWKMKPCKKTLWSLTRWFCELWTLGNLEGGNHDKWLWNLKCSDEHSYFFLKHLKRCVFPPQQNLMQAPGLDFITGWFGRLAAKILMPMFFLGRLIRSVHLWVASYSPLWMPQIPGDWWLGWCSQDISFMSHSRGSERKLLSEAIQGSL